jgi:hypothetical protein
LLERQDARVARLEPGARQHPGARRGDEVGVRSRARLLAPREEQEVDPGQSGPPGGNPQLDAARPGEGLERIGDRRPGELELASQEAMHGGRPDCGPIVVARVARARKHHERDTGGDEAAEGHEVGSQLVRLAGDRRGPEIRVSRRAAETGEMLPRREHARLREPPREGGRARRDDLGLDREGPSLREQERAFDPGSVGDRRQVDVDPERPQRPSGRRARRPDERERPLREPLGGEAGREPAEPPDLPSLLVDEHEEGRLSAVPGGRSEPCGERTHLCRATDVSAGQDHATDLSPLDPAKESVTRRRPPHRHDKPLTDELGERRDLGAGRRHRTCRDNGGAGGEGDQKISGHHGCDCTPSTASSRAAPPRRRSTARPARTRSRAVIPPR